MVRVVSRTALALVVIAPLLARGEERARVRMWDPATVVTLSGKITAVERVEMGDWACVKLRLGTDDGPITIRVGPEWFVGERGYGLAAGERIEVTGSRLVFAGEPSLVAGVIVRGDERIVLRDPGGRPAWAAR